MVNLSSLCDPGSARSRPVLCLLLVPLALRVRQILNLVCISFCVFLSVFSG